MWLATISLIQVYPAAIPTNRMLLANWGCPGPGQGGGAGFFQALRIEAVPVAVRTIPVAVTARTMPKPTRTALDSTVPNTAPLTVALAEAAVMAGIAEADRVDIDVIAAKTVRAPRR